MPRTTEWSRWSTLGLNVQGDLGPLTFYTSRRGKLVSYARAPPLTPATHRQRLQRDRFLMTGVAWQGLAPNERVTWERVSMRCNLGITGYNLFTFWLLNTNHHCVDRHFEHAGLTPPT